MRARTVARARSGGSRQSTVFSETIAVAADGSSIDTAYDIQHQTKVITATSANGLSRVQTQAEVGNPNSYRTETETTIVNSDGSSLFTQVDLNADGSLRDETVVTTSANGLSKTIHQDTTGSGSFNLTETDVTVLGSDGSSTETVTDTNADGSLRSKIVSVISSDRRTTTTQIDSFGDGHFDRIQTSVVNADGSAVVTASDFNADGSLTGKSVVTTSASGLSATTQLDSVGAGAFDQTETDVTVLNADGSRTETVSDLNADGSLKDKWITTSSATGLSQTTQWDRDGDGVIDATHTDVTALNNDGSRTETVTDLNHDGSLKDRTVATTSANGLSVTTQRDMTPPSTRPGPAVGVRRADGSGPGTGRCDDRDGRPSNKPRDRRRRQPFCLDRAGHHQRGVLDQTATNLLVVIQALRIRTQQDKCSLGLQDDRTLEITEFTTTRLTYRRKSTGYEYQYRFGRRPLDVTVLNADAPGPGQPARTLNTRTLTTAHAKDGVTRSAQVT